MGRTNAILARVAVLTAVAAAGCLKAGPLDVSGTASVTDGVAPLEVRFAGTAANGTSTLSWKWDFGDGASATEQNPVHSYASAGSFTATVTVSDEEGASATRKLQIVVRDPLTVGLGAQPAEGIAPLLVQFAPAVTGGKPPYSYGWNFGDGGASDQPDASHVFATAGSFKAVLVVTDALGLTARAETTVAVADDHKPIASIYAERTTGVAPLAVAFKGLAVGGDAPVSYSWDFGDGQKAQTPDVSHSFAAAGLYTVVLTVEDADGDQARDSVRVQVAGNELPAVELVADKEQGIEPLTVSFAAIGAGGNAPLSYAWDFEGDGTTDSTVASPMRSFDAGVWTVKVTVTDADGDSATDTRTVKVEADSTPAVTAGADVAAGLAPLAVAFDCAAAGGNHPLSYRWDFGDGQSSALASPALTYARGGRYTATCTVVDADGDRASGTVEIEVTDDLEPVAVVQAAPAAGFGPLDVAFRATVTGGNAPLSYAWNFGDGETAEGEAAVSHVFEQAGEFTVVLTVADADGDRTAATSVVRVADDLKPVARIGADVLRGIEPLAVRFTAGAAGGNAPLSYSWDFEADGTADAFVADPVHVFKSGTFDVALKVVDASGDVATDTLRVEVEADTVPAVEAQAATTSGLAPLDVAFDCAATGGNQPRSYLWDFGDGRTSNLRTPATTYAQPGRYRATCSVVDADGDRASAVVEIVVTPDLTPAPVIQASALAGIAPLAVSFKAADAGGNGRLSYAWDFGDGSGGATTAAAAHTFENPGDYVVSVVVTDEDGDQGVARTSVSVATNRMPAVQISADRLAGVEPLSVRFTANAAGGDAPLSFAWDFDGDSVVDSRLPNPARTFAAGTHSVTVTVKDANGDAATDTVMVAAAADTAPQVTARATPSSGLAPVAVAFDCAVAGGNAPVSYRWSFGDGQVADVRAPVYTYARGGEFSASCLVTDADGDTASGSVVVKVADDTAPVVVARASPPVGFAPLEVAFAASAAGGNGALTYAWDFGDGQGAATAEATHAYAAAGDYAALVTVTDADGDSATATVGVRVTTDLLPAVSIAAEPRSGLAPLAVTFTAHAAGGNAPLAYSWDFDGDGKSDSALAAPTRVFAAGTTLVRLVVTDANGDTATDSVSIEVAPDSEPVVAAGVDRNAGLLPHAVMFACDTAGGNAPISYRWDFGDGRGSTLQAPAYTYTEAGTFTATCTATDADGDVARSSVEVATGADLAPVVAVAADATSGLAPLTVRFSSTVSGGNAPLRYEWDFGDGSGASIAAPANRYLAAGTYRATLTVTDADGDKESASLVVSVGSAQQPAVTASATPPTGAAPLKSTFACSASGGNPPYLYRWEFGDGGASESAAPVHTYAAPGEYEAVCRATDAFGQVARSTVLVVVRHPNTAPAIDTLLVSNGYQGLPQECAVAGQTTLQLMVTAHDDNGDVLRYEWVFDTLPAGSAARFNNASARNPSFEPDRPGRYVVRVGVSDGRGGVASGTLTIEAQQASRLAVVAPAQPVPGEVDTVYGEPLILRATTECGLPVAALPLEWKAANGRIVQAAGATGADGRAAATVRLGCAAGVDAVFTATFGELRTDIPVPTKTGAPYMLLGTAQESVPVVLADGTDNPMAVEVKVADRCGNRVTGADVEFRLESLGDACFDPGCRLGVRHFAASTSGGSYTARAWSRRAGPAAFRIQPLQEGLAFAGGFRTQKWDFERDGGGFAAGAQRVSEWQWGTPAANPQGAHSGSKAWATVLAGDYDVRASFDRRFVGLPLAVPKLPVQRVQLRFWEFHDLADSAIVNVSVASPWNANWPEAVVAAQPEYDARVGKESGYAGRSLGWRQVGVDLTDVAGWWNGSFWLYWVLHLENATRPASGWAIDDVELEYLDAVVAGSFAPGSVAQIDLFAVRAGVAGCDQSPAELFLGGMVVDKYGNRVERAEVLLNAAASGPLAFAAGATGTLISSTGDSARVRLGPEGEARVLVGASAAETVTIAVDGTPAAAVLEFVAREQSETAGLCGDNLDNDCSGAADCADLACAGFCVPDLAPGVHMAFDRGNGSVDHYPEVMNRGNGEAGPFDVAVFARPSPSAQPRPGESDGLLKSYFFGGLRGGAAMSFADQYVLPPGTWDFWFVIDPGQRVAESDETNNAVTAPVTVTVAGGGGTLEVAGNGMVCLDGADNDSTGRQDCEETACRDAPMCQSTVGQQLFGCPSETCNGMDDCALGAPDLFACGCVDDRGCDSVAAGFRCFTELANPVCGLPCTSFDPPDQLCIALGTPQKKCDTASGKCM